MMIDNRIKAANGIYNSASLNAPKTIEQKKMTMPQDQIVLSTEAQSFSQVLQKIQSSSDVRSEKVTEYTQQIQDGKYQINGLEIAGKMLNIRF